eukprot:s425_g8.t3
MPVTPHRLLEDPSHLLVMQWTHQVLREPTFCTTWGAIERARGLAFELGTYTEVQHYADVPSSCAKVMPSKDKAVHFGSWIEFRFGYEDQAQAHTIPVPLRCDVPGFSSWNAHFNDAIASSRSFVRRCIDSYESSTSFFPLVRPMTLNTSCDVEEVQLGPQKLRPVLLPPSERADGSTIEEPLLSSVLSPMKCAQPSPTDPADAPHHPADGPAHHHQSGQDDALNHPAGRDPGRPHFDNMPMWVHQIWHTLETEGVAEDEEEGKIVYYNTYYISHWTNPTQKFGRISRLDQDFASWEDELRLLWEDLGDPSEPIEVDIVAPDSPVTLHPEAIGTLLITQHPHADKAACVTTAMIQDIPFRVIEVAHSFERITGQRQVLFHSEVLEICDRREELQLGTCKVRVGRYEYPPQRPIRVHDGMRFQIDVPPPIGQADWENSLHRQLRQPRNASGHEEDHDETGFIARSPVRDIDRLDDQVAPCQFRPFECVVSPWSNVCVPDQLAPPSLNRLEQTTQCTTLASTIDDRAQGYPACNELARDFQNVSPQASIASTSSSRSGDTHRPEYEPTWAPAIWELLRTEGVVENDEEGPLIYVTSYFISHTNHPFCDEPRLLRFDADFREWNREIRAVWEDVVDDAVSLDVVVVQPAPPHFAIHGTVATVIVQQHMMDDRHPILTTAVFISDPITRFYDSAHSAAPVLSFGAVLRLSGTAEVCSRRFEQAYGRCTIHVGFRILPMDQDIPVHPGLGLTIRVPAPLTHQEAEDNLVSRTARSRALRQGDRSDPGDVDAVPEAHPPLDFDSADPEDEVALMARRPQLVTSTILRSSSSTSPSSSSSMTSSTHSSSATSNWCQTVVFVLDGQTALVNLPWGDRATMLTEVARAFMLYENEISCLYRVSNQPSDFIENELQCILLRRSIDHEPAPGFCIALFDVEVYEPSEVHPSQLRRFVRWVPATMTRRSTIRLLGLESQCQHPSLRCTLWHNNVIIGATTLVPLRFAHGDYVKVLIRNPFCSAHPQVYTESHDGVSLLQTTSDRNKAPVAQASDSALAASDDSLPPLLYSFTEAFLNALRLMNQAAEDLPEFQDDPETDLDLHPAWVRDIYEAWNAGATIGPGGMERLGRLETWFTDHLSYQSCHYTRIAVLGPDFSHWEQEIRILWRDRIINGAVLDFHVVEPLPEDASNPVIAQIVLVQRPVRFQRSIIISIYDSDYDRGMPHSIAAVTSDRIDLHTIRSVVDAVEDCPPEAPANVCALWVGNRQLLPHERVMARHGHAFRLLIHRRHGTDSTNMTDLDDPLLRDRLQYMAGLGPMPFPSTMAILSPGWAQDLHRAFAEFSFVERGDEGPVAYLQTWHLNGLRALRCQHPRTVRLRSDASSWQRSITDIWDDRLDLRLPFDLFWVDPSPLNSPLQSYVGHIIILQEPQDAQAALLLTALLHGDPARDPYHVAVCGHDRLSSSDIIDIFPIPGPLLQNPTMIRRDQFIWPARSTVRVGHGENIVIEIQRPQSDSVFQSDDVPDAEAHSLSTSLLQFRARLLHLEHSLIEDSRERLIADVVAHAQQPRVVLHLASLVSPPVTVRIDFRAVQQVRDRILHDPPIGIMTRASIVKWHPSTIEALDSLPDWLDEPVHGFAFFTDGSALRNAQCPRSAAAVVLIIQTAHGDRFGGFRCFDTSTDGHAPHAEAAAMFMATIWAAQLCETYTAQGQWRAVAHDQMQHNTRALVHWIAGRFKVEPTWHHVPAHTGHPWNEAADAVAWAAVSDWIPQENFAAIYDNLGTPPFAIAWLWMLEQHTSLCSSSPDIVDGYMCLNVSKPFDSAPMSDLHPFMRRNDSDVKPLQSLKLTLRCATANVLTLYQNRAAHGNGLTARLESLLRAFDHEQVLVIGAQETRSRLVGHTTCMGYHVLSAPATDKGVLLELKQRMVLVNISINGAGEHFHQWLHDQDLFLPQTFEEFHSGDHVTWTHSSGHAARLDYIAVAQSLRHPSISTRIANVDLTLTKPDHCSVQIDIPIFCRTSTVKADMYPSCGKPVPVPQVPWGCDVHTHAARIQDWMQSTAPPRREARLRKAHLQESTWRTIQCKRFHWTRIRQLRRLLRLATLCEIFTTWRCGRVHEDDAVLRPWLRLTDRSLALHEWQHRRLCGQVAYHVRNDDRLFYEGLADRQSAVAADEGLTGLWRHLRHVLPKSIKKRQSNIRCSGPHVDELTAHYCSLEAGREVVYSSLLEHCHSRQKAQLDDLPLLISLQDLPTRVEIEQVCKLAKKGRAPGLDGVQAEHLQLMRDAHQDTWFTCPLTASCFETHRGSRPGSPLADLAYNILMSAVLRQLQAAVIQQPRVRLAHDFLGFVSPTVAWVDDVALPVPCIEASQLDSLLHDTMLLIHQTFRQFGLRLNCSTGKTEAIVLYRGPGAPDLRRQRFLEGFGKLDVAGYEPLHLVPTYTHLGLVVAQNLDVQKDVSVKIGKATAAYRTMSRSIFLNRRLPVALRLKLLDTLVLPILFYGCGSWPLLSARQYKSLSSVITKWQRHIAGHGFWNDTSITDAAFRAQWRLPSLAIRLAKHRLLFLLQLHRHGPQKVWDFVLAEDEYCKQPWLDAVRHALSWLASMDSSIPAQEWSQAAIMQWCASAPPTMPNQIRRAVARHLTQEETAHHVLHMHKDIQQLCIQHGGVNVRILTTEYYVEIMRVNSWNEEDNEVRVMKGMVGTRECDRKRPT